MEQLRPRASAHLQTSSVTGPLLREHGWFQRQSENIQEGTSWTQTAYPHRGDRSVSRQTETLQAKSLEQRLLSLALCWLTGALCRIKVVLQRLQ